MRLSPFPSPAVAAMVGVLVAHVSGQTVTIANGMIQGVKCASTDTDSFLGIPYAQPPVGSLRYAAPVAFEGQYQGGTLQATKPANNCPQFGSTFIEHGEMSEDCLVLDIYKPRNATAASKLPVKVWLYGGFNEAGGISDPTYSGCFSAAKSIVVTVNYRVGPLGWLSVSKAGISGNFGTQDQLLALKWVKTHITAFGGDASRVLLFGQSAGAVDSFILGTLPQATELISAAALESGAGRRLPTIDQAEPWNEAFVKALNCSVTDAACIRSVSLETLNKTELAILEAGPNVPGAVTLLENNGKGVTWGPTVDGDIIPEQPVEAGLRVRSIVGSNTQEGTIFLLAQYKAKTSALTQADYDAFLSYNFGPLASTVNQTYSLAKFAASIPSGQENKLPALAFFAMSAVVGLNSYVCTARRALRSAVRNQVPVFAYSFNHAPSCSWYQAIPTDRSELWLLGPTHSAEIPFVFGLTANLPPPAGNCTFTQQEVEISKFMLDAWDEMAAVGLPGDLWPAWTEADGRGLVVKDQVDMGVVDYSACTFWDKIDSDIAAIAVNETARRNGTSGEPGRGPASGCARTGACRFGI